jgi:hypothetical protein
VSSQFTIASELLARLTFEQSSEIHLDGTGSCAPLFHCGAYETITSRSTVLSEATQIVASAVNALFGHFGAWTRLRDLHLSNIAFPRETEGLFPTLPTLRMLHLGQATLVPVVPLACFLCDPRMDSLRIVRLVDCYVESIWGPRVRRADLERAVVQAQCGGMPLGGEEVRWGGQYDDTMLDRIRTIVRCEALTERIIGGDRADGLGVFE